MSNKDPGQWLLTDLAQRSLQKLIGKTSRLVIGRKQSSLSPDANKQTDILIDDVSGKLRKNPIAPKSKETYDLEPCGSDTGTCSKM